MDYIENKEDVESQNLLSEEVLQPPNNIDILHSNIRIKGIYKKITILIVFFTLSLWFTDRYLRYNLTETKYRIAVSLEPESARPIMRSVAKELSAPTPELTNSIHNLQYLEFLASIEEGEEILKLYESLHPYNNQNPQFLINLGCREYLYGNYENALKHFSEASNLAPYNSLPIYLLSASILKLSLSILNQTSPETNLDRIISYIAKENRNNHLLIFPEPFWHPSLPTNCYGYYLRKKEIYERTLSPIYELCYGITNFLNSAETEKTKFSTNKIKSILEELFLMAEKIGKKTKLNDSYLNSSILHLSLTIQRHVLTYYKNVKEKTKITSDLLESNSNKLELIYNDLSTLSDLDSEREKMFEKSKYNQFFLLFTIFISTVELLFLYLILKIFNLLIFRTSTSTPHPKIPQIFAFMWGLVILTMLLLASPQNLNLFLSNYSYSLIIKVWLFLNLLTPIIITILTIIIPHFVYNTKLSPNSPHFRNLISLLLICHTDTLFYQICTTITAVSIWFLIFRFFYLAYPYQVNLLPDIFAGKELCIIKSIIQHF